MRAPYLTRVAGLAGVLLALAPAVVLAPAAAASTGGGGLGSGLGLGGAGGLDAPPGAGDPPRAAGKPSGGSSPLVPVTGASPTTPRGATPARGARPAAGRLVIRGGGDGHGVGMSQYGAEGYALHGLDDRAILAHYYTGTTLGEIDPGRIVRVLLADGRASFSGATSAATTRLSASHTYTVTAVTAPAGGADLRVTDAASGRAVATLAGPLTVSGSGPLRTAGGAYRGSLVFSADAGGGVRTVDAIGLDDYIRGVVGAEMPSRWAPAALQAQAIAARTYAITTTVNGAGYDLYDDTRSQSYRGVAAETPATNAAVTATAGQIVTYAGRPAVTYFFASSGGHTESIQNAWAGAAPEPWLIGVPDPYDDAAGDPYHSWQLSLSLRAATAKLGSLVRGTLTRIVVTRRGASPRIVGAEVVGTRGTTAVTGAQLQQAFGLMSTDATFTVG